MTTTMVVTQPQPAMISRESQEWSSGICDCTQDVPECCFAFWCLPCFTCITAKKYGECLCLPLLDYIGFGGCIPAVTMSMRASMRQRYGIQGTMCKDCAFSTFCVPCVWCQMSREMKARNIQIVMVGAKHTNPPAAHYSKR
ncbi:cornifelin-like [Betta splendens]|uniref:Cornifelin-like n=1 Tax=Betta splendens TaxID=158456 RepID=A0A6P7PBK2_BETSP|nr:cornifelin-like [Betta splendens]XP_040929806.1 cornifelin-like [Betta splendens]XP_055358113.1 cornifelin-like [Betta splendens]